MLGIVLNAIEQEAQAFLEGTGGMLILKTNVLNDKGFSHTGQFVMLEMIPGEGSGQYMGGLTQMEYMFAFNSYNYAPDAYVDDPTGYSTSLLEVIDDIRRHFSHRIWLTQAMKDIHTNYGFKFTLSGIGQADAMEADGLLIGNRIEMESVWLDTETSDTIYVPFTGTANLTPLPIPPIPAGMIYMTLNHTSVNNTPSVSLSEFMIPMPPDMVGHKIIRVTFASVTPQVGGVLKAEIAVFNGGVMTEEVFQGTIGSGLTTVSVPGMYTIQSGDNLLLNVLAVPGSPGQGLVATIEIV